MPEADGGHHGGLPLQLTSFIGRRREIGDIRRLVAESRLVTITGVGGSGKSRLAMRVAEDLRRAFRDGVWYVDLAGLRPPDLVSVQAEDADVLAYLISVSFGLRERLESGLARDHLTGYLEDRNLILLVDNAEHMLAACAELVDQLLRSCPNLSVLTTSREPLMLSGEAVYQLSPMPVPDATPNLSVSDVSSTESVALFVARAQALVPEFQLTESNARPVASICRQLDGLPLAIELAAAWVRVLAPSQILERLGSRFKLLSQSGRHARHGRQQTLRGCVEWSFDLCSKPERLLWVRLSVFTGGFELDAAEAVCADDRLPAGEILDVVAALVDKSVLIAQRLQGTMRYRMLETLRSYGEDRLRDPGSDLVLDPDERVRLRFRHLDWSRQLVERANEEWLGPQQREWIERLERELANLRMALRFGLDDDEPGAEAALAIARRLRPIWITRGQLYGEALYWLQECLTRARGASLARVEALADAATLAIRLDTAPDSASDWIAEAHALAEELRDPHAVAIARTGEALLHVSKGRSEDGRSTWRAAVEGLSDVDSGSLLGWRLYAVLGLSVASATEGDLGTTIECYEEVARLSRPRGEAWFLGFMGWATGYALWLAGRGEEAAELLKEALQLLRNAGDRIGSIWCIGALARIEFDQGRAERAAVLIGAMRELSVATGADRTVVPRVSQVRQEYADRIHDALGDRAYAAALERGRLLSLEDLIGMALGERSRETAEPGAPAANQPEVVLSAREREVAELVAEGLSNRQIAERLVISTRTAEGHVQRVLVKLGFTSRAQLAAWVTARRAEGR